MVCPYSYTVTTQRTTTMKKLSRILAAVMLVGSLTGVTAFADIIYGSGGTVEKPDGTKYTCPRAASSVCAITSANVHPNSSFPDHIRTYSANGDATYDGPARLIGPGVDNEGNAQGFLFVTPTAAGSGN